MILEFHLPGRKKAGTAGDPPGSTVPAYHEPWCVCECLARLVFSAPGSPRTPAALEYYVADNLEIIETDTLTGPPAVGVPIPFDRSDRRCLLRLSAMEAPRPLPAS